MIVYDKYSLNSSREIDPNGFLRVSMSNITKSQVRPYLGREIPDHEKFNLDPNKIYNVLCSEEELKKAAKTFNNLPLTRDHIEIDVDDVPKEKIVGSLGDHATVDGKYLKNNLIIYDKKDIDLVLSGKKKELSCGYRYTPIRESGEFDGQHYDFKMTDIVGNHVALVKQGRAGRDVMVADTSKGLLESIKEKILAVFDNDLAEDAKEKDEDEVEWITVKGNHIPVGKGQSKEEAVKSFIEGKKNGGSEKESKQKKPEFYVSTENDGDGQYYTVKAKSEKKNGMDIPLKKFETQKEAFEYKDEMDSKFSDKKEPSKEDEVEKMSSFLKDEISLTDGDHVEMDGIEYVVETTSKGKTDSDGIWRPSNNSLAIKKGKIRLVDYEEGEFRTVKVKDLIEQNFKDKYEKYSGKKKTTNDADLDAKQEKVGVVMKEFKDGELKSGSGEKVTDPKQAIAIALSEAEKLTNDLEPDIIKLVKEKEMKEEDVDELVQDAWSEETEYNGQTGHYLTTKNGHHIFIPNGTTTKEAISKHFDELRNRKQKELGENPWRDKEGYQTAKSSLERIKSGQHTIIGTAAAADLDKMIKELEGKIAITEEKKKEYDSKISQLYDECSKALKEAEAESEEGKPESKIKEETEYEDVEFKAPRQREAVEKSGMGESDWEKPVLVDIGVPDSDNVSYDIMDSVMGQMSDGMWENSRAVEKYWRNANITKKDGTIGIKVNTASSWANPSPYSGMSDEEIRGYFAKKIKAVVKQELEDNQSGEWSRDNETQLQYLSRGNRKPVRVKDAYKLYDHLLGRNKK